MWAWIGVAASAQQPLTLAEVQRAAEEGTGALAIARYQRRGADGALIAARSQFDPLYLVEAGTSATQALTFDHAIPFTSHGSSWFLTQSLGADAPTGTSWSLDVGLTHDYYDTVQGQGQGAIEFSQDSYGARLSASVTQQLLRGFKYSYNVQHVDLARAQLGAADLEVERQRQTARLSAEQAYWTWVYAHDSWRIAEDAVGVAQEALRVARLQVERGPLAPLEATRLEAAYVQAQQDALDARNLAEQAANTVLVTIGMDPGTDVVPATPAGDVPPLEVDPAKAVEVALAQNLDLQLARNAVDAAGIERAAARHGVLPALSATLGVGTESERCRDNSGCTQGNALDTLGGLLAVEQPGIALSGQLAVPIGNRAARGARDQAEALVDQRQRELQDLERAIAAEVEEQVRALASAGQRVALADANLRLAQDTLSGEEALLSVGRTIEKNVLEARTGVAMARVDAAKARTDYQVAQAALLALQGQLAPR